MSTDFIAGGTNSGDNLATEIITVYDVLLNRLPKIMKIDPADRNVGRQGNTIIIQFYADSVFPELNYPDTSSISARIIIPASIVVC